jgi:dTDP-4-dehydrorhamnose 3,5-epimerase-like enzyme
MARLADSKLIKIPVIRDSRGNLSSIEGNKSIPFDIKRVFYLYDVPGGAVREGHAQRQLHQVIFALSGSFDVVLDDGFGSQKVHLNRSFNGLYVPNLLWRGINNFSTGSVCMVLASDHYEAGDYIRSYDEYLSIVNPQKNIVPNQP